MAGFEPQTSDILGVFRMRATRTQRPPPPKKKYLENQINEKGHSITIIVLNKSSLPVHKIQSGPNENTIQHNIENYAEINISIVDLTFKLKHFQLTKFGDTAK